MADFPTSVPDFVEDDISAATLAGKDTDDATYGHASMHRKMAQEVASALTYLGTNASQTTPVGSGRVLASTSSSASTWTADPSVTSITTSGAGTIGGALTAQSTLAVTGATTLSSTTSVQGDMTLNNAIALQFKNNAGSADISVEEDSNDNLVWKVNGTVVEIWVPTTGDIAQALTDAAGKTIRLLPGTHTPAAELALTTAGTTVLGGGRGTTIVSASSFSTGSQSIFRIAADECTLKDMKVSMDTNSDRAIEFDTSSATLNRPTLQNLQIVVTSGDVGIYTDATNNTLQAVISGVQANGSGGQGLDGNGLNNSFIQMKIDVASGTHWTLDANSDNNYGEFIVDLAGTDSGGGTNTIEEVVF